MLGSLALWEGSMKMKLMYSLAMVVPFGLVALGCAYLMRSAWCRHKSWVDSMLPI